MPELTPLMLGLLAAALGTGLLVGWLLRGSRTGREKAAINTGWQDQLSSQKNEHDRLAEQNKSLMEQVSQYRASKKDSDLRARELSESLKEAFEKRDELQRQMKEVRSELEVAAKQRDKLQRDIDNSAVRSQASEGALKEKDEKIFKLSRELESWQGRLPPLIERYQLRDREAIELEEELEAARERIAELEQPIPPEGTRIEAVDNPIADGMDASNEQYDETSEHAVTSGEYTGIETYLEEGTVDFDLGDSDRETAPEALEDELEEEAAADAQPDSVETEAALNGSDRSDDRDDLQQIKGVGPAIEKTLNDLGIYRFNQIAEMSEYDIDRVARELRGFRSRIYREDWIGQARLLQYEKASSPA